MHTRLNPIHGRSNFQALFRPQKFLAALSLLLPVAGHVRAADSDEVVVGETYVVRSSVPASETLSAQQLVVDAATPALSRDWSLIEKSVPNLYVGSGGAGSFGTAFSLRGLANTPYFSDPSVTVYLDDLPLGSSFTYPASLSSFPVANILKGPQGTAVGRSGEAGVIVLESAPPGLASGGEVRGGVGSDGRYSVAANLHAAGGSKSDIAVNAWHQEQDGFITNTALGRAVDPHNETGANARFRFHPTDRTEIALQLFGQRSRNGAQPLVPLGGPRFTVDRASEGRTDIDSLGAALRASVDLGEGTLTSVTSYSKWKLDPYQSHLVLPPAIDSRIVQDQRTWNEELRYSGRSGGGVDWTAGMWLSKGESNGDVFRELTGLFPIEGSTFDLETRSAALFGEVSAPFAEKWHVTAGLRLQRDRKHFDRAQTIPYPGAFVASRSDDELLGKLEIHYDVSKETRAFGSISTGAKPGGYSAYTGNVGLAGFDPEHLLALEAGVRNSSPGRKLTLSASAFAWFIRDYQIERSFTQTDYLVVNAPRARSVGGEFSATWRPADGWHIDTGLGVAIVTLRKFTDPFTDTDYSGNRAPYAPEFTGHVGIGYQDKSGWFASANLSATGKTRFDESEAAVFTQDSYILAGARAGYDAKRWRVTVYGDNLADVGYYSLIVAGVYHGAPGLPRNYGAEVTLKF